MNKYCTDVIHVLYFLAVFYKRCLKIHGLPATFQKLINCIIMGWRGMERAGGNNRFGNMDYWWVHVLEGARVAQWERTRLPPMWPGFNSRLWRHMWVEFVIDCLPCSERFSLGTPVVPSSQKPTLSNSNLIWNARTRLNEFIWTLKCFVGKKAIYNLQFFTLYISGY